MNSWKQLKASRSQRDTVGPILAPLLPKLLLSENVTGLTFISCVPPLLDVTATLQALLHDACIDCALHMRLF
jgi:hypothetical protein